VDGTHVSHVCAVDVNLFSDNRKENKSNWTLVRRLV